MNWQTVRLAQVLMNPRITRVPLRVLRELRRKGIERLPEAVHQELQGGVRKKNAFAFMRNWLDGELLSRHRGQWVLNSFLPPFPGEAFDRMFENLLSGRHLSPVSVYLAVTATCPYDCWHCSLGNRRNGNLSSDVWLSTIRALQNLGTSVIGFTGGEPLSRPDLPELVRAAVGASTATIVFSTGAGMTEKRALELRGAGLWAFCVSLDHPEAETYDHSRGTEGAYERAIEAIALARKMGFYTMMGSVATRRYVEHNLFGRLYEIARKLRVHEYRIVEPMPCGKLSGANGKEALLASVHIAALREFHVSTNRKGRLPKVCAFNQIESPEVFGCGGGTQHMFVDPAGEVCPCDFTPLSFGNIAKTPLEKIWSRMNKAMGDNPRRHCFIQRHHELIDQHAQSGYPLSPEVSESICKEGGREALPDYFAMLLRGGKNPKKD